MDGFVYKPHSRHCRGPKKDYSSGRKTGHVVVVVVVVVVVLVVLVVVVVLVVLVVVVVGV